MKNEENKVYRKWLQSQKLRELQEALDRRKREILNTPGLNLRKYILQKRSTMMTLEEIVGVLDNIIEFSTLDKEDKEAFDWLEEGFISCSKEDVLQSLISTTINWSLYLRKYEIEQEFELCSKIKQVIDIEIAEAKRMIDTYFIMTDSDLDFLDGVAEQSREAMNKHYDDYLNKND